METSVSLASLPTVFQLLRSVFCLRVDFLCSSAKQVIALTRAHCCTRARERPASPCLLDIGYEEEEK